jgi:hypothetical protein
MEELTTEHYFFQNINITLQARINKYQWGVPKIEETLDGDVFHGVLYSIWCEPAGGIRRYHLKDTILVNSCSAVVVKLDQRKYFQNTVLKIRQ